jgi:hypothetical protein
MLRLSGKRKGACPDPLTFVVAALLFLSGTTPLIYLGFQLGFHSTVQYIPTTFLFIPRVTFLLGEPPSPCHKSGTSPKDYLLAQLVLPLDFRHQQFFPVPGYCGRCRAGACQPDPRD